MAFLLAVASASFAFSPALWLTVFSPFRLQLKWHSLSHRHFRKTMFINLLRLFSNMTCVVVYSQSCFTPSLDCSLCDIIKPFGLCTCLCFIFHIYYTDSLWVWPSRAHSPLHAQHVIQGSPSINSYWINEWMNQNQLASILSNHLCSLSRKFRPKESPLPHHTPRKWQ